MKKSVLFLLLVGLLSGCISYQQIQYQRADLFRNKRVEKHIKDYDVYVHSEDGKVVLLDRPAIGGGRLSGEKVTIKKAMLSDTATSQDVLKKHRGEIHVFVDSSSNNLFTSEPENKLVVVPEESVTMVRAVSTNEKEIFTGIMLLIGLGLLIVAGIIFLVGLIIALIIKASVEGANASSDGSGASSDGSAASSDGSAASSDGAGASSDASAGSGSSGCYIATMAYGDYDHPQVLELRKFRDEYLLHRSWGRQFVSWYYQHSPHWVQRTKNMTVLHAIIRVCLNLFISLRR